MNTLLGESDILLQEHWLLNNGVMRLSEAFQKHHVYGKGGIVVDELLLGCPYGGVAIFVNKTLNVSYLKLIVKVKECVLFCVNLMNILFYLYQFTCHVMREKFLMNTYVY